MASHATVDIKYLHRSITGLDDGKIWHCYNRRCFSHSLSLKLLPNVSQTYVLPIPNNFLFNFQSYHLDLEMVIS